MISKNFLIKEFLIAGKGKKLKEFLGLIDAEATEAERMLYSKDGRLENHKDKIEEYVNSLKTIYFYLQSSVRPYGFDDFITQYVNEVGDTQKFYRQIAL